MLSDHTQLMTGNVTINGQLSAKKHVITECKTNSTECSVTDCLYSNY